MGQNLWWNLFSKHPCCRFILFKDAQADTVLQLKVANGTVIVLSDMALVRELLDNRSSETCSRPPLHAANAVTGGNYMVMADFGKPGL